MTASELVKLVPTLDKPQQSVLLRTVLGANTPDRFANLDTLDMIRAGLWEFLLAIGFVSEVQATLLLHHMRPALDDFSKVVDGGATSLPVFRLTLAEKRWATWPLHDQWFDLYTQEHVKAMPEPAVLLVCCDVTAMTLRMTRWLDKLRSKDAKPNGPGEPG